MTKHYKIINNALGWALGIIASAIYIITAEPTASWWDCGEYIATTYKMLIGHPPGAPTFQLIGHFFTLFAGGDVTKVALCVNVMSAICSGLTIMFLFWTMTMLGRKLVDKLGGMTTGRQIALFGSALVGALTYTFTDSFWFSAVEGEVYAMSSFFTALVFWCILKWDWEYDHPVQGANPHRWMILIAYLVGLSVGVHLLNLLTLPAIALVVYFKLSKKASPMGVVLSLAILSFGGAILFSTKMMLITWLLISAPLFGICVWKGTIKSKAEWGVFLSLMLSFVLIGVILYGIIPGIVNLAGKFEIFFVNTIRLPFNSGTIIYFLLIFALVGLGLYYGYKKDKKWLQGGVFSFVFLLIGYSTFITLVIRSNANPTIDENNPDDAVSLLAYLNREQYGSRPLIYGQTYNSRPPISYKDGNPVYVRDDVSRKYVISDHRKGTVPVYRAEDQIFFPRMWSSDKKAEYDAWMRNQYDPNKKSDKEALRHIERNRIPTHDINVKFMHTFQLNYMYFRYFMWNFSGRQNDLQGRGDFYNGNWISGIPFIDNRLVGNQSDLPASMQRPGHNKYYLLPLLLGLIGLVFYSMKDLKNSFIVLLLFFMTGIAIILYLNDYAFQPRERDYAYAASFYAFSIWIGFGVFAIYSLFEKIKNNKVQAGGAVLATLICCGLVPGIMAKENWDDHDRSNRYTALAFAKNYLDSCEPNAILFTMGDNDTFPLWYAQEVEGYRTDVRVCNLSLMSAAWYVDQMKRKVYNSDPLPISFTWDQYKDGTRDYIIMDAGNNQFVSLADVMEYIKSPTFDKARVLRLTSDGYGNGRAIPASFSLPVDKEKVLASGTVKPELDSLIVDKILWNAGTNKLTLIHRAFIMMMDILVNNNWERPIYFATTTGPDAYFGLEDYFQLDGFAYRLVPIKTQRTGPYEYGRIDSEVLSQKLLHTFNDHSRVDKMNNPGMKEKEPYPYLWGGFNDPRVYHNEDNLRLTTNIRRNYSRLAATFLAEGKIEKAEEVLDFGNKLLPDNVFPYKMTYSHYYSLNCISYIEHYMRVATPTAIDKGLAMADRMLDYFIEDYVWLEDCNERTLKIQSENLLNNVLVLDQLLSVLGTNHVGKFDAKLKQIKMSKSMDILINESSAAIKRQLKKFDDSSMQAIFNELVQLDRYYLRVANATGNNEAATKIIQVMDTHLAEIEQMNPQLAEVLKNSLAR